MLMTGARTAAASVCTRVCSWDVFSCDREVEERLKNMEVRAVDQTFRQHEGDDYLRWIDEGGAIGPESAESEQSFTSTGLWFSDSLVNWAFWLDE